MSMIASSMLTLVSNNANSPLLCFAIPRIPCLCNTEIYHIIGQHVELAGFCRIFLPKTPAVSCLVILPINFYQHSPSHFAIKMMQTTSCNTAKQTTYFMLTKKHPEQMWD